MTSARDVRDEQADYRQSVEDRFLASAESHPDVVAAAHAEAVAQVKATEAAEFAMKVAEIEKTVHEDGPTE